ncbi:MAG: response regulator [Pseudomonadota bacterium]
MMKRSVLIVEDEEKITNVLKDYLERAGFEVYSLDGGGPAAEVVREKRPDVMILDLMLPDKDGLTVCREIRAFSDVPILMLTARTDEVDKLVGLELGADDYITKPFSPREVAARVKAVLRRTSPETERAKPAAGPLILDSKYHQAAVSGRPLFLTPTEFTLLETLSSQPGRVFSRIELVGFIQGDSAEGYDRTIDSHIKNLRKKLADHLPGKTIIKTVYGVGYTYIPVES